MTTTTVDRRDRHVRPIAALEMHVQLVQALKHNDHLMARLSPESQRMVGSILDRAVTIVVTPKMLELVERRMAGIEFGQPLTPEMLPFENALVVFPHPVLQPDADEDDDPDVWPQRNYATWDVGMWLHAADQIGVSDSRLHHHEPGIGDPDRSLDGILYGQFVTLPLAERLRDEGDLGAYTDTAENRDRITAGLAKLRAFGCPVVPAYLGGWQFDRSWDPELREDTYVLSRAGEYERRFWLSLWKTLGEEVVAPVSMPRRLARRVARGRDQIPEVVVADLRRLRPKSEPEEHLGDGTTVLWSHRWPVVAHTRVLYRGTPWEKHVPVKAHIKGPEHLPIIVKDRVYRLKR